MEHGAYYVHKQLRTELKNYICSQYFGKTPILLQALSAQLDQEGVLYRKPFLESSPAYQTRPSGMSTAEIPDWMKKFFCPVGRSGARRVSRTFLPSDSSA